MNVFRLTILGICFATAAPGSARGEYESWRHQAALPLLTTPDGADLPAAAREENFPVLVRLDGEHFDFNEARRRGRYSFLNRR